MGAGRGGKEREEKGRDAVPGGACSGYNITQPPASGLPQSVEIGKRASPPAFDSAYLCSVGIPLKNNNSTNP